MAARASPSLLSSTPAQRKTLLAAALGWMLDAFDTMLYALVLTHVMRDLGMSKGTAGLLNTLTLLASGIGGVCFGFLADRVGRKRALMLSILTYSVCSFASGLSTSVRMLAIFRFILGLGMGGEWNTGAALVAETWPSELRAKALALVQSSFAIGYAIAAVIAGLVLRFADWRAVFFVGIVPALLVYWIQRSVPESTMWNERAPKVNALSGAGYPGFLDIFRPPYLKYALALLLLNFCGLFAWWGLFTWIPPYLSLPVEQGGRGFGLMGTTALLVALNLAGMFPGYISFGWFADRLGRRLSFALFTLVAALLVPVYASARAPAMILMSGTVLAFFGTGFFSGSSIVASEIFPTQVRARALGFTYNGARSLSAVAPFVIGWTGQRHGLGAAFSLCGVAFLFASLIALTLPETRGKSLE